MKGRFRPHHDQLMVTGEAMIKEQFLEYFEMDNMESNPENNLTITDGKTDVELKKTTSWPYYQVYGLLRILQS